MGLFTRSENVLFTTEGVKRLYQFFILNFIIVLLQILIVVILLIGLSSGSFFNAVFSLISSVFFGVIIWIIEILIMLWLFWAFTDMILGRKEFDKQHEISVIIASAFLIPSIFLYLIQLIISKGLAISASTFYFNTSGGLETLLVQGALLLAISIILPIFMGISLFLFIHKLSVTIEKVPLFIAMGLLIASPFTLYFTGLASYILFFIIYRKIYHNLYSAKLKPVDKAPCPFCDKDIPMESRVCPYCGARFEASKDTELDPVLKIDVQKQQFASSHGYTPVKGPTKEEKNRLFMIIGAIIAIIVVVAVISVLI